MILREVRATWSKGVRLDVGSRIGSSRDVDALTRLDGPLRMLHDEPIERLIVLHLDAKNRLLGWTQISQGSLSACPVAAADVFRPAIVAASSGLVVVHNHPTGDPSPSGEDVALTERLVQAGRLLGIKILDHVITARDGYFSFVDAGLLKQPE